MALRLACAPMRRKQRKQLNLPLEKNSAAVLMLNTVCEFVFARETKSDALEDMEEEFVQVMRREALKFLPALNNDIVITTGINFNVRTCAIV